MKTILMSLAIVLPIGLVACGASNPKGGQGADAGGVTEPDSGEVSDAGLGISDSGVADAGSDGGSSDAGTVTDAGITETCSGNWCMELVRPASGWVFDANLQFSPTGVPYVFTVERPTANQLFLSHRTDAGWVSSPISTVGDDKSSASFALDPSGMPHAIYAQYSSDGVDYDLVVATPSAGSWTSVIVTTQPEFLESSTAFDSTGEAWVAFKKADTGELLVASPDAGSWTLGPPITSTDFSPTLDLDSSGNPHVAFLGGNSQIEYATHTDAGWSTEIVADAGSSITWNGLDLNFDDSSAPHVVYDFSDTGAIYEVRYATKSGGGWVMGPSVGLSTHAVHPSLAVDHSGQLHVAFVQKTNTSVDLLYATLRPGDAAWSVEPILSGLTTSNYSYPSIAISPNGTIAVVIRIDSKAEYFWRQ